MLIPVSETCRHSEVNGLPGGRCDDGVRRLETRRVVSERFK